jgi:NAD(P)-dependent dehydrogenase (short-subunit alcohol dehydrogenase family)
MPKHQTNSNRKLEGLVSIITGGTSGIGEATANLFADEGCTVIITGRRKDRGENVVNKIKSLGGKAKFIFADHTQPLDCSRVIDKVLSNYGQIDILFNNAGIVIKGTAENTTEEDWEYALKLNITAVWRMSKLVIPHMRARGGGVIVNNASDWGVVGAPGVVAYCTTKGAVIQMTRAMAMDHARENIRINAVCPGDTFVERWVEQGYFVDSCPLDREAVIRECGKELPIGRVGWPEDIAKAVLFLACNDSTFITGTTLVADGGNTAR